jgi:hypothetical protein
MRAGKRLDPFPNSYTGDPLAAYRLNIAKAGFPNWMMYLDSGPEMALAPPLEPEDEEEKSEEPVADDAYASEVDEEAAAGKSPGYKDKRK